MIHLFINALAASAGGGLTYIRNVIPHFAVRSDVRITVALSPRLREEFRAFPNVEFVEADVTASRRFWYEQSTLPGLIRRSGAHVLISAGNFAIRNSPVPQILLSRNSIYLSPEFYRDLRSRHEYGTWLDTRFRSILARKSILWADATVAPSEAFAAELRRWTGANVLSIHHGFDHDAFTRDATPLPAEVEDKLRPTEASLKLLFVSHYNYYRNFETLVRALPFLRDRMPGRSVKLLLTCKLAAGENPGTYNPEMAAKLVNHLGVAGMILELGSIPYHQLHQLYRMADVYVTPAYAETFAHPLVEAMAGGLPVIASDLAVHQEICEDAAAYFPRFSPQALAECAAQLLASPEKSQRMAARGRQRAQHFSWKTHVAKILEVCHALLNPGT
jgi:glycosyltransferase involved in cell wall biosynthesis